MHFLCRRWVPSSSSVVVASLVYMLFGTEQQAARQKVLQASIHPRHFGQYDQLSSLPIVASDYATIFSAAAVGEIESILGKDRLRIHRFPTATHNLL